MFVNYTTHAWRRSFERNISNDEVYDVIKNGHKIIRDNSRYCMFIKSDIKILACAEGKNWVVITAIRD